MTIRLQDILLILIIRIDSSTDITNRYGKHTLPSSTLRTRTGPRIGNGILGAGLRRVGIIIVSSNIVRIKRGIDDILHRDTAVLIRAQLVRAGGTSNPPPLMRGRRDNIILLPIVQVPGLPVTANDCFLRPRADALVIVAGAAAHDEDLLLAVERVYGCADEHAGHGVGDGVFVNAWKVEEGTVGDVAADIGVAVGFTGHQLIVGCREGFEGVDDDRAQDTT